MEKQNRPPCHICGKPVIARGLCDAHYTRWKKYGDPNTLLRVPHPNGPKEKHPLYDSWCWTKRSPQGRDVAWNDMWKFVEDVGVKPSAKHFLRRVDSSLPFGADNFYWKLMLCEAKNRNEYARAWRAANPTRAQESCLKKHFGIGIQDFEKLLEAQDHKCAICGKAETVVYKGRVRQMAVDHCHTTKKVRGLLCTNCNTILGNAKDSIDVLTKAIAYLTKYS